MNYSKNNFIKHAVLKATKNAPAISHRSYPNVDMINVH